MKHIVKLTLIFLIFFSWIQVTSANGYGWGYKKQTDGNPPEIGAYEDVLERYGAYYLDNSGEKNIYLTFDNGYEEGYTPEILDVLQKENVPALFFITGHYVETAPELVKRMAMEGHIIGNHSYHHPDFSLLTKDAMKKELEELEEKVAELTDQNSLQYVRPPRGIFNQNTLKWANDLGYTHIFWSIAFKDWETKNQRGWQYAYDEVMEQVHPGAIILLHTVSEDNAKALEQMIQDLKKQGYTFRSMDELISKNMLPKGLSIFE